MNRLAAQGVKVRALTNSLAATDVSAGSDASLHAKTFAVDRRQIFVGSFNFDPRSARLSQGLDREPRNPAPDR